jgi:hypothetical protein
MVDDGRFNPVSAGLSPVHETFTASALFRAGPCRAAGLRCRGADRLLGVLCEVAVGAVDHLHARSHPLSRPVPPEVAGSSPVAPVSKCPADVETYLTYVQVYGIAPRIRDSGKGYIERLKDARAFDPHTTSVHRYRPWPDAHPADDLGAATRSVSGFQA